MNKRSYSYRNLKNHPGISQHSTTKRYQAVKTIKGKYYRRTFDTINEARHWRNVFDGSNWEDCVETTVTLANVWEAMQARHFPTLARSTIEIWKRRYVLLQELEHLQMHEITSSTITRWIESHVSYFKGESYEGSCRGRAKRCNLNNELNLFTTIFNWYKACDEFEKEAVNLVNPVKTRHKKLGFIRPRPIKELGISLDDAFRFFSALKPFYRDFATFQYYTASRVSEVAGLQWNRVDFINKKIIIMETAQWDMSTKTFIVLNPHPKNKEPRVAFMTKELEEILRRRFEHAVDGCNFVFHVEGSPLNYCTIQLNYREAQRKSNVPYTGTHILRHGMAKLARQVGGGLDAVIAMTGHKDYKLADHYSKLDGEFQKETSEKIMDLVRSKKIREITHTDNVISLRSHN